MEKIVIDAKARGRFYNADEGQSLALAISSALIELEKLTNKLNMHSLLFKDAKWKVVFTL